MEVKLTFHAVSQVELLPESDRAAVEAGIEAIQSNPEIGVRMPEHGPVRHFHEIPDYVIMYDLQDPLIIVSVTEIPLIDDMLFGLL